MHVFVHFRRGRAGRTIGEHASRVSPRLVAEIAAAFESARLRIIPRVARYAVCDAADTSHVLKNAQFRVHPEVVIFLTP